MSIATLAIKPFHQWKSDFMKTDKTEDGVQIIRWREWYHQAYGNYCNKQRALNKSATSH